MASGHDTPVPALVGAALTAVAVFVGTGLDAVPAVTWLAPLPMLVLAPVLRGRQAGVAAFAGWALGMANLWSYATSALSVPVPVAAGFIALHAAGFAALVLWFGALVRRGHRGSAVAAVGAAAAAADYLESLVSPHGTFLSLAVTQASARASARELVLPGIVTVVAVGLVAVLTVIGAPMGRGPGAPGRPSVAVAALSTPIAAERPPEVGVPDGDRVLADLVAGIGRARAAGAAVAVLPEASLIAGDADLARVTGVLRRAAGPHLDVVVGVVHRTGDGVLDNEAVLLVPGRPDVAYRKRHLVPGSEDEIRPGDAPLAVDVSGSRWGLAVCKDLDFPPLVQAYARDGVQLLLVPVWDVAVDGRYHSRIALLRSVEHGLPMVRAARDGRLTVTDRGGRVVAEAGSSSRRDELVVARLVLGAGPTLYTRFGDWFAWLCLVFVLTVAARQVVAGRWRR